MRRISVAPAWIFRDESGESLDPKLFVLLGGIREHGKLTQAAKQAGISYRHSWNLLNQWAAFFGCELVHLQKGRGASLTSLGEKLLWAEQRAVARLEPQLKSFASELNVEIQRSIDGVSPLLHVHASFGYAVELLPKFTHDYQLDLQYKGAEEALISLNKGNCDVAGFHLPMTMLDARYIDTYRRHLRPRAHKIVRFITRRMGLMVKPDNPLQIASLQDLMQDELRFINRERQSATRLLLDELLDRQDVAADLIQGFDDEEYTHSAVAAYVAAGMADVGFGVEAAARQFGLQFIPLVDEQYLMVCHQRTLQQEAMRRFVNSLRSEELADEVRHLAGYSPQGCGEIISVEQLFGSAEDGSG